MFRKAVCVVILATCLLGTVHGEENPDPKKLDFKDAVRREGALKNYARVYRDVHATKGVLHKSVYESFRVPVSNAIGEGTYARTFTAWDILSRKPVVVKAVIPPLSTWRVKREIKILSDLQGGPSIIQLTDLVMHSQTKLPAMVLEYFESSLSRVQSKLDPDEVKYFTHELLKAIDFMHSKGYMHRDIKMSNVVVNRTQKLLRLIDFNVAERYQPGELYTMWVMSSPYRAPELFVNLEDYDYSLDMWGFGVIMAKLIFQKDDFFDGPVDNDYYQLRYILETMGTEKFDLWLEKYGLDLDPEFRKFLGTHEAKPWPHFVTQENYKYANAVSLDLIDKLLRFDQADRLTAKEAMAHPYYADLHGPQVAPDEPAAPEAPGSPPPPPPSSGWKERKLLI